MVRRAAVWLVLVFALAACGTETAVRLTVSAAPGQDVDQLLIHVTLDGIDGGFTPSSPIEPPILPGVLILKLASVARHVDFQLTGHATPLGAFDLHAPADAVPHGIVDVAVEIGGPPPDFGIASPDLSIASSDLGAPLDLAAPASDGGCPTGGPCQRVFLTSTTHTGNLGGISGADGICQSRATAATLGGTWRAWISVSGDSPSTRFARPSSPYYLLDGTIVATSWTDLTKGTIANPINRDELNAVHPVTSGAIAWTSTNPDGTFQATGNGCGTNDVCGNWTGGNCALGGDANSTSFWTTGAAASCTLATTVRLYCFEQ